MGPDDDFRPPLEVAPQLVELAHGQGEAEASRIRLGRDAGPADLIERIAGGIAADAGRPRPERAGGAALIDRGAEDLADRPAAEDDLAFDVLPREIRLAAGADIDDLGLDVGVRAARGQRGRHLVEAGDLFPHGLDEIEVSFLGIPCVAAGEEFDKDIGEAG